MQTRQLLGELQADAAGALANLRDLARGIYPPLLADLGLAAALNAQASKSPLPVTVEADGIGRFGQDTEAAVYFCCLEALQNTAKYAHATQARICLQAQNGTLRFTVSDDGTGYDTRHTPMGSGLRNMADRLAALGGRLEVQSAPGQGTTITGHSPRQSHARQSRTGVTASARPPGPDHNRPGAGRSGQCRATCRHLQMRRSPLRHSERGPPILTTTRSDAGRSQRTHLLAHPQVSDCFRATWAYFASR